MNIKSCLIGLTLASSLALSACGETAEAPAEDVEGIAGLEVSNPRLVLAPVSGNPAALYFDLDYSGDRLFSVSAADVAGAGSAMLHDYTTFNLETVMGETTPQPLKKGERLSFEPGGLHVMAMDVSPDLAPGGTAEVTLIFSGGDKHSFDAEIRSAGDER